MLFPGTWDVLVITTVSAGGKLLVSSEFRTDQKAAVGTMVSPKDLNQPLRDKAIYWLQSGELKELLLLWGARPQATLWDSAGKRCAQ